MKVSVSNFVAFFKSDVLHVVDILRTSSLFEVRIDHLKHTQDILEILENLFGETFLKDRENMTR